MAPHLTAAELDFIHSLDKAGGTPITIHQELAAARRKKRLEAPRWANAHKAIQGNTRKRGPKQTRGRKKLYSRQAVLKMDKGRGQLVKKTCNNREVLWGDIRRASGAPAGHRTTL